MRFPALVGKYIGRHLEEDTKPTIRPSPPDVSVLARSPTDWPEDLLERFDERAGIMEFDGGMPRGEAEWWAEEEVRGWLGAPPPLSATENTPMEEC